MVVVRGFLVILEARLNKVCFFSLFLLIIVNLTIKEDKETRLYF